MDLLVSLVLGAGFVVLVGLVSSFVLRNNQKKRDTGMSPTVSKHPLIANPVFWAYVGFLVICVATSMWFMGAFQ